jgi:hypothetical protein
MDRKQWITVPPGHMVVAREGEPARLAPFMTDASARAA